jgi:hypothetical protein
MDLLWEMMENLWIWLYPLLGNSAAIVIDKLEKSTKAALLARDEQGARGAD